MVLGAGEVTFLAAGLPEKLDHTHRYDGHDDE
jgi:hypothetical protein